MDEVFLRFPGLGRQICSQLGNLDLIKLVEVSKLWKACMEEDRLLWNSIIKKLTENRRRHADLKKNITYFFFVLLLFKSWTFEILI